MTSAIELERETTEHIDDPRWSAVLQRDARWDGAFVFAVTSTRIYCRPSCPSRRPRADRVRFYANPAEASQAGFRACKRCAPDAERVVNERQVLVTRVMQAIDANEHASLDELATITGIGRSHLQRTFTEVIGVSPHEFITARKTERMRAALSNGSTVSSAAFDAGFESLPRAYAASAQHLGMAPGAYRRGAEGVVVRFRTVRCALGIALVALTERGVCRVILGNSETQLEQELRGEFPNAAISEVDDAMAKAIDAVVAAASGKAQAVTVPLDLQGTAFQRRVWRTLMRIPSGETISYTTLAGEADSPNAVRAVGSACGANPVALLVPCHRVVRSDGGLGGYRWGLERKRQLLEAEREERG